MEYVKQRKHKKSQQRRIIRRLLNLLGKILKEIRRMMREHPSDSHPGEPRFRGTPPLRVLVFETGRDPRHRDLGRGDASHRNRGSIVLWHPLFEGFGFPRCPGGRFSPSSRYSFRHSLFTSVHSSLSVLLHPDVNAPLPIVLYDSAASVLCFSPGHFRRRTSRLVSYYALFECVAASEPTS